MSLQKSTKANIATPETDKYIRKEYKAREYLRQYGRFFPEQAEAIIVAINIMKN